MEAFFAHAATLRAQPEQAAGRGGERPRSGVRYIIPLFIYLDVNKATGKPRGWLLESAGMQPGHMAGLDAVEV